MSLNKPTDLNRLKQHYGLALEEIKLERSINNMHQLIAGYADVAALQHFQNELDNQQRQLRSLRKLRGEQ